MEICESTMLKSTGSGDVSSEKSIWLYPHRPGTIVRLIATMLRFLRSVKFVVNRLVGAACDGGVY